MHNYCSGYHHHVKSNQWNIHSKMVLQCWDWKLCALSLLRYTEWIYSFETFSHVFVSFLCVITFLKSVCCQMFGVRGPPSPGSIWITTGLGDVFVFDPAVLEVRIILISKTNGQFVSKREVGGGAKLTLFITYVCIYFCFYLLNVWRNKLYKFNICGSEHHAL